MYGVYQGTRFRAEEYAAAITRRIGGTLAGVTHDPRHVLELMKATYNYMRETAHRAGHNI